MHDGTEARTVDGKHVLGVARVAITPGLVGDGIDLSCTVIPLIEAHGYQALTLPRTSGARV